MSARRNAEKYELYEGLSFVDRMSLPRALAYTDDMAVFLRPTGRARPRKLFDDGTRSMACPIVFSPDGATLYHAHEQLMAIDVASARARPLTRFAGDDRFGIRWHLYAAPDGRTLYFLHGSANTTRRPARVCAVAADGSDFRVVYDPRPDLGEVWSFACDFSRGELDVVLRSDEVGLRRMCMDLEGRDPRVVSPTPLGEVHSILDADVPHGKAHSISPDGSAVAFVHNDHAVLLHRSGSTKAARLVAARGGYGAARRWGSFAVDPVWSPDGRLLWFSSTTGKRSPEPRDPARLKRLLEHASPEARPYTIERARWRHKHRVGIIDWMTASVWMTKAFWRTVAWMP